MLQYFFVSFSFIYWHKILVLIVLWLILLHIQSGASFSFRYLFGDGCCCFVFTSGWRNEKEMLYKWQTGKVKSTYLRFFYSLELAANIRPPDLAVFVSPQAWVFLFPLKFGTRPTFWPNADLLRLTTDCQFDLWLYRFLALKPCTRCQSQHIFPFEKSETEVSPSS